MKKLVILSLSLLVSAYSFAQQDKAEEGMAMLQQFMEGMANAETRSVYKFPITMNMHIVDYNGGKKKEEMDVKYHVNTDDDILAFVGKDDKSNKQVTIVYDAGKSTMVMVDEAKKSYMAMSIKAFESMDMQKMMQQHSKKSARTDVKCNKSGKTKTIQGYACEQMVCTDSENDGKIEVWTTDKIPVNIAKSAKSTPWAMYFNGLDGMNGMMMKADFYEKGKLEASMNVTEVNTSSNYSVKMSELSKMDMFGGGR